MVYTFFSVPWKKVQAHTTSLFLFDIQQASIVKALVYSSAQMAYTMLASVLQLVIFFGVANVNLIRSTKLHSAFIDLGLQPQVKREQYERNLFST